MMVTFNISKRQLSSFLALFAMAVSILVQTTPIWATQSDGTPLVICNALGTTTITINENGEKVPNAPQAQKQHCVICNLTDNKIILSSPIHAKKTQATTIKKLGLIASESLIYRQESLLNAHGIRAPPAHA